MTRIKPASSVPSANEPLTSSQPTIANHKPALTKRLSTDSSCEETRYQPPPTLIYNSVDKDWQSGRSPVLDKVWKEIETGKSQVIDYDTRPVATVGMRDYGNCFFRTLSNSNWIPVATWTSPDTNRRVHDRKQQWFLSDSKWRELCWHHKRHCLTWRVCNRGRNLRCSQPLGNPSLDICALWCECLALAMLSAHSRSCLSVSTL